MCLGVQQQFHQRGGDRGWRGGCPGDLGEETRSTVTRQVISQMVSVRVKVLRDNVEAEPRLEEQEVLQEVH